MVWLSASLAVAGPWAIAQAAKTEPELSTQEQDPVKLSSKEIKKLIVKRVWPEYPAIAHTPGGYIVGKCVVEVTIDREGNLARWRLVMGHPMLAPAAVDAVKKSKYRAYVQDGHPVEAQGEIEFDMRP